MRDYSTTRHGDVSSRRIEAVLPLSPATMWISVIQSVFEGLSSLSSRCRDLLLARREGPVNHW